MAKNGRLFFSRSFATNKGRYPSFNQNFRKFQSKTQWIGSVQPEKFRLDRLEFLLNGSRQERMSFSLDRAQKATKPTEIFCNKERIFRVIFFNLRLISLSVSLIQ